MDRHYHDGPSFLYVITFRDFPSDGLQISIVKIRHERPHDGPSYSRRTVTLSVVFHCYSRDVETNGGTTGSVVADETTNKGVQTTEVVGFGELDPPAC